MTIDISHLVVIGCSFGYCQGLEFPSKQGWPALLANRLGVPVVNLSSKGAGNDRIMRRLFEYHYLNSHYNNNPFYIISYSHSSRREEYSAFYDDYRAVELRPGSPDPDNFTKPCVINYNQEVVSRKKLMIQAYILNFLKANNIHYLTTDYKPEDDNDIERYVKTLFPQAYIDVYLDQYRLRDFTDFSKMHPSLPCGHDDLAVQIDIANYTFPKILELFGNINVTNQQYATLKEYARHFTINGINKEVETDWL